MTIRSRHRTAAAHDRFDPPKKILVVEDDPTIAEIVAFNLEDLGCDVQIVEDGTAGLARASSGAFDLIVLDLMLPGTDGFDICERLRTNRTYTPILVLTARSTDHDRVLGLELGADDYVTKPFNVQELRARVKALFRRIAAAKAVASAPPSTVIAAGRLTIDGDRRVVALSGRPVPLTVTEFELLAHLARQPGRVYSRSELLDLVWGYRRQDAHTVNSHINRLRAKLEDNPSRPRLILTVWGVGYKLRECE